MVAISQKKMLQVKKEERTTQQQVRAQNNEGRHGDTKSPPTPMGSHDAAVKESDWPTF